MADSLAGNSSQTVDPSIVRTNFRLGHRPWLDGLRGLAILLVLAFHLGLLPGGSLGVDLFFVLSGFLITAILVEEWNRSGTIRLSNFYVRRALRLWPAFFVLLGCYLAYGLTLEPATAAALRQEVLLAACYVSNWPSLHQTPMDHLGFTWSLSVEEQFYLLWPILLLIMLRLRLSQKLVMRIVGCGILTSALWRGWVYSLHRGRGPEKDANLLRMYMGTDTRADALLVGCLLALIVAWNLLPASQRFILRIKIAAGASWIGIVWLALDRDLGSSQYYHGLFTLLACLVATIIARMLVAPSRLSSLVLEAAPLRAVGRVSYGLYLFHGFAFHWCGANGIGWRSPGRLLSALGITLAATMASHFLIERPCLRWKDRFRFRETLSQEAASATRLRSESTSALAA